MRAVLAWIAAEHPTLAPPALVGWSRGGGIAMLVAQSDPRRISALVLFGFVYDPAAGMMRLTREMRTRLDIPDAETFLRQLALLQQLGEANRRAQGTAHA